MRSPQTRAYLAVLVLTLGACAAELEQSAGADEQAVLDHVEALGYARESAEIDGDVVLVEGDVVFDRTLLLEGAYEARGTSGAEFVEKGYRYSYLISKAYQGNVKLVFATGAQAPNHELRTGFLAAAKAWSSIPGSAVRVSTSNSGPAIKIKMIDAANWKKPYTPCPQVDACANAPVNGRPGSSLYIRSASMLGDCVGWSGSNLASVTRHELGHTLGFAHPKEPDSVAVPGTQRCPLATEAACAADLKYTTIMGPAHVQRGCIVTPDRLTKDDYATCTAVYPEVL